MQVLVQGFTSKYPVSDPLLGDDDYFIVTLAAGQSATWSFESPANTCTLHDGLYEATAELQSRIWAEGDAQNFHGWGQEPSASENERIGPAPNGGNGIIISQLFMHLN